MLRAERDDSSGGPGSRGQLVCVEGGVQSILKGPYSVTRECWRHEQPSLVGQIEIYRNFIIAMSQCCILFTSVAATEKHWAHWEADGRWKTRLLSVPEIPGRQPPWNDGALTELHNPWIMSVSLLWNEFCESVLHSDDSQAVLRRTTIHLGNKQSDFIWCGVQSLGHGALVVFLHYFGSIKLFNLVQRQSNIKRRQTKFGFFCIISVTCIYLRIPCKDPATEFKHGLVLKSMSWHEITWWVLMCSSPRSHVC